MARDVAVVSWRGRLKADATPEAERGISGARGDQLPGVLVDLSRRADHIQDSLLRAQQDVLGDRQPRSGGDLLGYGAVGLRVVNRAVGAGNHRPRAAERVCSKEWIPVDQLSADGGTGNSLSHHGLTEIITAQSAKPGGIVANMVDVVGLPGHRWIAPEGGDPWNAPQLPIEQLRVCRSPCGQLLEACQLSQKDGRLEIGQAEVIAERMLAQRLILGLDASAVD